MNRRQQLEKRLLQLNEELKKEKKLYRPDVYKSISQSKKTQLLSEIAAVRVELNDAATEYREALSGVVIPTDHLQLGTVLQKDSNGEPVVNEEYLRQLPLLQNHFAAALNRTKNLEEYEQALVEASKYLEENETRLVADALYRAVDETIPTWVDKEHMLERNGLGLGLGIGKHYDPSFNNIRNPHKDRFSYLVASDETRELMDKQKELKAALQDNENEQYGMSSLIEKVKLIDSGYFATEEE